MNTRTDQNIQRVIELGAVLVVIGMGLNILVMQTLGSFDTGAVILGLFLGFWALVLGTGIFVVFSSWFFIRRKHHISEPVSGKPEAEAHASSGMQTGHRRMCPMH